MKKSFWSALLIALSIMCLLFSLTACNNANAQNSDIGDKGTVENVDNGNNVANGNNGGDNNVNAPTATQDNNMLVVYFSATGNTKAIAEKIASMSGGTLYEIVPSTLYTSADLNYNNSNCRANVEQNDVSARPAIANSIDISLYDTVFIGYPIWWGKLPKIIYTFFDAYDFSGKKIIPFCTSGGSGISTSVSEIKTLEPNATVADGNRFSSNASELNVKTWIDGLGLVKNEIKVTTVNVYCGGNKLEIELADTVSAKNLVEKLKESDITINMHEYGGFEMVGGLGFSLNRNDEQTATSVGDVVLYGGNQIVIFYGENNWLYTRIGKIKEATKETILAFLRGTDEVTVRFSIL